MRFGVLGVEGIVIPAADFAQCAKANACYRAAMLRYEPKIHSRLLVHLIAAGALQVEQPREQIRPDIQRDHAPHHPADLWIEERRDQLSDQPAARDVVGVKNKDHFGLDHFHRVFQGSSLASLCRCVR